MVVKSATKKKLMDLQIDEEYATNLQTIGSGTMSKS